MCVCGRKILFVSFEVDWFRFKLYVDSFSNESFVMVGDCGKYGSFVKVKLVVSRQCMFSEFGGIGVFCCNGVFMLSNAVFKKIFCFANIWCFTVRSWTGDMVNYVGTELERNGVFKVGVNVGIYIVINLNIILCQTVCLSLLIIFSLDSITSYNFISLK